MISGLQKRYGQQGRQDHAMNQQQSQMRSGSQQASANQLQGSAPSLMDAASQQSMNQQPMDAPMSSASPDPGMAPSQNSSMASHMPPSQPGDNSIGALNQPSSASQATSQQSSQYAPASASVGQVTGSASGAAGQQGSAPPPAQSAPQSAAAPEAPKNTMQSPFGQMNFGGAPQMKSGQIVTKPTRAIIGEHGPEAVVPLDGHAGSRITPGMMGNLMPKRYDATGPTALHGPMRPMKPAITDPKMSNWKRYDSQHAGS